MENTLLSERLAVLGILKPQQVSASTVTSSYVNLAGTVGNGAYFQRYIALVQAGTNGTGNLTVSLIKASDTNGTGSATVLQQTAAAGAASGIIIPFDVNQESFNDTSKTYIALQVGTDSGTCNVSGLILGGEARYAPAQAGFGLSSLGVKSI